MQELSPFPTLAPERRTRARPAATARPAADLSPFPQVEYTPRPQEELAWRGDDWAPVWGTLMPEPVQALRARVPLGIAAIDEFLSGGIPAGSVVVVIGPPFGGKRALASRFLAAGMAAGAPALAILTDGDVAAWRKAVGALVARVPEEGKGLACFLDLFGGTGRHPSPEALPTPDQTLHAVATACAALPSDCRRVVLDSFSMATALSGFPPALSALMRLTAHLQAEGATTLVLLEAGAHTEMELQLIKRQADGALEFRAQGGPPEVQVTGLGLTAPSPWLPCRAEASPSPFLARPTEPFTFHGAFP